VALFIYLRISNPEYIEPLWTTEIGRKMLAGLVVGQILGAISIRHIVNIKV
jgi:tight adherence protein B